MANFEGLSTMRNMMMYNGKSPLLPPKSPFPSIPPSYVDYLPSSQKDISKSRGGSLHQRTSSESCIIEEQPSWLDDLLNEPEITPVRRGGGHRRSSSDSFTNFHTANLVNLDHCIAQDDYYKDAMHPTDRNSPNQQRSRARNASPNAVSRQQDSVESVNPDKKSPSENDTKRAKQQFAQRSRVRKLQYISELERNVQHLQAEGSEVSAELEFLNQQNLILGMENKALKQRLENLAQEQLIKYLEHEVLERERGRLRALYQQQQLPLSQQQQLPFSSHRRTTSRDLDQQFSDLSLKHKEGSGQLQM